MSKAAARDCDHCGRRIGATRTHYITASNPPLVVCVRCLGRTNHNRAYPHCPHAWHDMHDHPLAFSTRAAVQPVLDALTDPTPTPLDVPCPTCKALRGLPCAIRLGRTWHAARQDKALRVIHRRDAIRPW